MVSVCSLFIKLWRILRCTLLATWEEAIFFEFFSKLNCKKESMWTPTWKKNTNIYTCVASTRYFDFSCLYAKSFASYNCWRWRHNVITNVNLYYTLNCLFLFCAVKRAYNSYLLLFHHSSDGRIIIMSFSVEIWCPKVSWRRKEIISSMKSSSEPMCML